MNLRDAGYFVVAAEAPSFGRAAERCHLTQQALSAAIARLERDIGETLFVRHRRGVELTDAGARLLPRARAVIALADEAIAAVRASANRTDESCIRLGIMEPGAAELMSPIIQAFRRANPSVAVAIRELRFAGVSDALAAGDVDVAVGVGPVSDPRVRTTTLFHEPRSVLLPRDHALAEAAALSINDVAGLTFLPGAELPEEWIGFWRLEDLRNGERPRTAPPEVAEAHSPSEVNEVVAAGIGVVAGPLSHRRAFPHPQVAVIPLLDAPGSSVAALVPANRSTVLADAFVCTAIEVTRRLVGLVDRAWLDPVADA